MYTPGSPSSINALVQTSPHNTRRSYFVVDSPANTTRENTTREGIVCFVHGALHPATFGSKQVHLHPGTLHPGRLESLSTPHTPGGQHHLEHNEAAASGRRWWRWEETYSPSRRIDGFIVVVQRPGSCGHGGRRWWCGGREKNRQGLQACRRRPSTCSWMATVP